MTSLKNLELENNKCISKNFEYDHEMTAMTQVITVSCGFCEGNSAIDHMICAVLLRLREIEATGRSCEAQRSKFETKLEDRSTEVTILINAISKFERELNEAVSERNHAENNYDSLKRACDLNIEKKSGEIAKQTALIRKLEEGLQTNATNATLTIEKPEDPEKMLAPPKRTTV